MTTQPPDTAAAEYLRDQHKKIGHARQYEDWARSYAAELHALLGAAITQLTAANERADQNGAEAAVLLEMAQGFDEDDRDYERINNLAGCENNHWRTQLREFLAGEPLASAHLALHRRLVEGRRALTDQLKEAADLFQWYGAQHLLKIPPDEEKAERNYAMAKKCDAVIRAGVKR